MADAVDSRSVRAIALGGFALDRPPILATMVGKRVLVEWIGVEAPSPEEDEDEIRWNGLIT